MKAFNTLAHLNLLYMHQFSWRMATVQMRLMLHREYFGRSECVHHHGLFIQPNITLLICLQRLCDHTFCLPMMHLPFLFLSVCPSNVCCVFTFDLVTELPLLCVCIYTVCLLRKKEVMTNVLMQMEHLLLSVHPPLSCAASLCVILQPLS